MWTRLQNLRWYARWPVKWLLLALTLFVVSYPNPFLFARHVSHWQNPNAMIDPDYEPLQPWVQEVRDKLRPNMQPSKALKTVERFVYDRVPYKFDWETWGQADYLPTLPEVLEQGAEDCDGRAVVAASILRKLGYQADLVTDFAHVWVKTDQGDALSHGRKKRSVVATDQGLAVQWKLLTDTLPEALAYSVAPFPLGRELIVLGVLWLLLLRPGVGWRARLLCAVMLLEGLFFLRAAGQNWRQPVVWAQWLGVLHVLAACAVLFALGWRAAGRSAPTAPQEPG